MSKLTVRLSHFLNGETPGYGGSRAGFSRTSRSSICCGQTSNSEVWEIYNHHGTHLDCPYHFCADGKKLNDYQDHEWFFSSPYLINYDAKESEIISLIKERESIPMNADCLLIKTGFEEKRTTESYWNFGPGLTPELGEWLRTNRPNVQIIGFDFISLTSYQNREVGRVAHRAFLCPNESHSGIRIIEDMKLSSLKISPKVVLVSPLMVENADGSPVTIWCEQ